MATTRHRKTAQIIEFPSSPRARSNMRRDKKVVKNLEFMDMAKRKGFMHVNDQERELLNVLRWTSYTGRDIVSDVAKKMRECHPWRAGEVHA